MHLQEERGKGKSQKGKAQGNAKTRAGHRAVQRADLMTGRQRAAPALALSSGGSSVHKSRRGRHSK